MRRAGTALLLLTLLGTAPGVGQTSAAPSSPAAPREMDLSAALAYTLALDPTIDIARLDSETQYGVWVEALGAFDSQLALDFEYERSRGELLPSQVEAEEQRRDLFRTIITEFTRVSDDLERQLEEGGRPIPDCRSANIVINGVDICLSDVEQLSAETFDEMLAILIENSDGATRDRFEQLQQEQLDDLRQLTLNIITILRNNVTAAEDSLAKLGVVPDVEEEYSITFDLQLQKRSRNGIGWAIGLGVDSLEDNYDGKPLNPSFGGKGVPVTFRSFFGLGLEAPLLQGRGRQSTTALEQAAHESFLANRYRATHRVDESLLATTEAWFRTLAAEQRLGLLREALDTDRKLGENVRQLIEADELPRITQARIDARVASQEQSVAAAAQAATRARVALANAMGLEVGSEESLPTASGSFPALVAAEDVTALDAAALQAKAIEQRYDLRGAERASEGSRILRESSRLDLRRPLDLTFSFGYSGLYETLKDDYYDPSGFGEALTGKQAGPSAFLGLRLGWPIKNRAAQGRLAQSEAVLSQTRIREAELRRSIGSRVSELLANLATAATEVSRRQAAADHRREELDAELARFSYGESTVIDTILSEENLTFARLDLVNALLDYALAFARLRFEIGDLTVVDREDGRFVIAARDPEALFRLPTEEAGP